MNKKESRILKEFPSALDEAVTNKFGVKCESKFDFLGDMNYVTYHEGKGQKKKEIRAFIDGWIAGNVELAKRLKSA